MLDIIWILLLLIAIFLMLIIAEFDYHDYPYHWVIILTLMDVILWAVLSADVWALEIPYEVAKLLKQGHIYLQAKLVRG